ncbi:MAG: GTP-binding protein [Candidatus Lokiarchaeota archaeon]|nr:GTP-binding protein [Candidatus Lokiarchaeota archaeon]
MSSTVILSVLYSRFDQRAGPVPACWHPLGSQKELLEKAAIASMNITFGADELPEKVAIIPVPGGSSKIVVRCIKYRDHSSRGNRGESTLSLVVSEAGDAVLYKYLPDFQPIFDDYAKKIATREEGKQPVEPSLLAAFHDAVSRRVEELRSHELGQRGDVAFPDEEKGGGAEKGAEFAFKIIVIGDPSVGKTSLILRFTDHAFRQTYLPTIGTNLTEKEVTFGKRKAKLVLWDIAGQTKFNTFRKGFYNGARGIIVAFDLTSPETFANVRAWYDDAASVVGKMPCLIIGNKLDLADQRAVADVDIQALAKELGCDVILTSALTGEHVDQAFIDLAKKIHQSLP